MSDTIEGAYPESKWKNMFLQSGSSVESGWYQRWGKTKGKLDRQAGVSCSCYSMKCISQLSPAIDFWEQGLWLFRVVLL